MSNLLAEDNRLEIQAGAVKQLTWLMEARRYSSASSFFQIARTAAIGKGSINGYAGYTTHEGMHKIPPWDRILRTDGRSPSPIKPGPKLLIPPTMLRESMRAAPSNNSLSFPPSSSDKSIWYPRYSQYPGYYIADVYMVPPT
ncbi:hypothetical protein B0H11DRAFT_1920866 [Mycena galericulata]|nr:hypothetical protein B0H11DRAFT_1920866 [Mycena galericulata]